MSKAEDVSRPPVGQTASVRGRVRRYRERKRAGVVRTVADLHQPIIADLVTLGWLAADKREDREAVGTAFRSFARCAWTLSRQTPILFKAPPILPLLAMVLILCSCTTTFTKPDYTEAGFRKDIYECKRDAGMSGFGGGPAFVQMVTECMEVRGYSKVQ